MAAKKACESFSKSLIEEVHRWASMKQTGVSLRYMMEFGSKPTDKNLLISAQFLHKELPIRIARRAIELENLPYGLSEKLAVLKVLPFFVHCNLLVVVLFVVVSCSHLWVLRFHFEACFIDFEWFAGWFWLFDLICLWEESFWYALHLCILLCDRYPSAVVRRVF